MSGFNAVPEYGSRASRSGGGGMALHVLHDPVRLAVGGAHTPLLRLWDLEVERCLRVSSVAGGGGAVGITCLTSVAGGELLGGKCSGLLLAGCTDGSIQVLGRRCVWLYAYGWVDR